MIDVPQNKSGFIIFARNEITNDFLQLGYTGYAITTSDENGTCADYYKKYLDLEDFEWTSFYVTEFWPTSLGMAFSNICGSVRKVV